MPPCEDEEAPCFPLLLECLLSPGLLLQLFEFVADTFDGVQVAKDPAAAPLIPLRDILENPFEEGRIGQV